MRRERCGGRGAGSSALAAACSVVALATLAASCSERVAADVNAFDATTEDSGPPPPRTLTFVIDQLSIDPTDGPDVPHTGFNLDDLFSTNVDPLGCTHQDYYSAFDDDQHCSSVTNERCTVPVGCRQGDPGCVGGVDNQFPTLANTIQTAAAVDIRAEIQTDVMRNRLSLIVRVTGVNDMMDDDAVRVALYRGYATFSTDCGVVAAGREYAVDQAYLSAGATDIDTGAVIAADARIVAGRLRTLGPGSAMPFDLPLSLRGIVAHLPIRHLHFSARLASGVLSDGSLGGWVGANEILDPCYGPNCGTARGIIGGLVDVQVNGVCDGSALWPPEYGGISLGLGVHAVPAFVAATPVSGPRSGTCGANALSDGGSDG